MTSSRAIILMTMIILIIYIAPTGKAQENFAITTRMMYAEHIFFNCHLNESSVDVSLICLGRLFQAGFPASQKARTPNLVQDDRLCMTSLTSDANAAHNADDFWHLSLMISGQLLHRSKSEFDLLNDIVDPILFYASP